MLATCKGGISSSVFQWGIITPAEILKWNPLPIEAGSTFVQVILYLE